MPNGRTLDEGLTLGIALNEKFLDADGADRRAMLADMAQAGLDHLTVGDHLSFHDGSGFDGIVAATAALSGHDSLRVLLGVYLAALRHPLATARALSTLGQLAPGRLVFGVGVGGEDRVEIANAGVDPATRGRRMDETLDVLRRLGTGERVTHRGEFFTLEHASVRPAPQPRIPIVIGGAGDVAIRRTVAHGDGWLGMWCSARRYAATQDAILAACDAAGRAAPTFSGLTVWVSFDDDVAVARDRLGAHMSGVYHLPPEKFAHISAAGTPQIVADFLLPYVQAGARTLTLIPLAASTGHAIESAAQVKTILTR